MMSNEITTETVKERVVFLACEWSLIAGWLLTIGVIWRQTLFYGIYVGIGFGWANRAVFIAMIMLSMCMAVVALTMTGAWLQRRKRTQSLFVRWLIGVGWLACVAAVGYFVVIYYAGYFSS